MKNMESLEKYANNTIGKSNISKSFLIPLNDNKKAFVIASEDFVGWDHVSAHIISVESGSLNRTPNNEEMQFLRNIFFEDEDVVVEFHPAKKDYINNYSYALHMWKSTDNVFSFPKRVVWKSIPSKVITLPNQKMVNIRRTIESGWDIVNVRTLNKKKHIAKKYATWEDMCFVKKNIYGEDDVCVQFRYKDMNEDFSIDIFKPIDKQITTPPSILVGSKSLGKLV